MADIKADEISKVLLAQITNFDSATDVSETGSVISVGDGIARIYGLQNAMAGELLDFGPQCSGIALNLEQDQVGAVLLGDFSQVREGAQVRRTKRIMSVPVGEAIRTLRPEAISGHAWDCAGVGMPYRARNQS